MNSTELTIASAPGSIANEMKDLPSPSSPEMPLNGSDTASTASGSTETANVDSNLGAEKTLDSNMDLEKAAASKDEVVEDVVAIAVPDTTGLDGEYGWIVVAANFTLFFFSCGLQYCWGTYIRNYYFSGHFGPDATYFAISFVGALNSFAFPSCAPFSGTLIAYLGPQIVVISGACIQALALVLASFATQTWMMLLSQGFLFGLGEVGVYMGGIQVLQQWFLKKRGLAIGLALSGSGFGGLTMNTVCQILIDKYGFPWSLRILAFILLGVGTVCGGLMKGRTAPGYKTGKTGAKRGPILNFAVFKNVHFLVLYIGGAIANFGYFVPFLFMSSYATSQGIPANLASLSLGLMNGASAFGRIAAGFGGDKVGYLNAFVFCQLMTPLVILLIWPFAYTYWLIVLTSVLYGFFAGGFISILPPMMVSIFGGGEAVGMLGMQMSSGLVASLAGPPIAGLITDAHTTTLPDGTKEIDWIFTILYAGLVMLVGNLPLLWIRFDKTKGKFKVKI